MGSEMCIRDSERPRLVALLDTLLLAGAEADQPAAGGVTPLLLLLGARAEPGTACDEEVVLAGLERLLDEDVSLGTDPDVARERAQRFREHDEALLRTQYLVQDDEKAIIQTVEQARRELEQLFSADRGEGELGGLGAPPKDG